jgi:hypothetical protein
MIVRTVKNFLEMLRQINLLEKGVGSVVGAAEI